MQSTGHTHPGKAGGIGPRASQGQLGCQKERKGGAKSPGAKTIWRGRGFARQRDCSPGGGWGGISTRNGLRLVSKVCQQCRRMWFGTGDLAPRPMLPLLGCSFVRLPPAKVLDIERRKSESLSLFQKLNFSGEGRVLSPGWRPLPRPRRRAESPGRPSLSLPSLGHPRTQRTPPPPQSGPLASHRDQRDVRGAAATTSKPAPKPSWAGPRPAFILGGGLPGVTGRRTNLVGGRLPPGHAPRPAWDTGATS